VLARGADGTTRWATGRLQSYATAVVAVAAAQVTVDHRLPAGVHHLHQVLTLDELPDISGIEVHHSQPPGRSARHRAFDQRRRNHHRRSVVTASAPDA
jgi:hypothetical protein